MKVIQEQCGTWSLQSMFRYYFNGLECGNKYYSKNAHIDTYILGWFLKPKI